jgi:hypothetical protein
MSSAESKSVVVVGSINEDVVLRLGRSIQPGETVTAERVERLSREHKALCEITRSYGVPR